MELESTYYKVFFIIFIFSAFLILERVKPLRKPTMPKLQRIINNLSMAGFSTLFVRLCFFPFVAFVANWTEKMNLGLFHSLEVPQIIEIPLSLIILDYTFYWWHRINHEFAFLWRFHQVHHIDLDLDVSTATRFHFGELFISAGYRSCQILVLGIGLQTLIVFEALIVSAALFQHSNILITKKIENLLNALVVTPRMHGIHHSIVQNETDSNYSTIFSFWDKLHHSFKKNIPQSQIIIGVPYCRDFHQNSFIPGLLMPFKKQKQWKMKDGTIPERSLNGLLKVRDNSFN